MRMLSWARGKTKRDHINNEDIWRIEERKGGYHQDDAK